MYPSPDWEKYGIVSGYFSPIFWDKASEFKQFT